MVLSRRVRPIEAALVVTLSGLSLSIFLSQTGIDICGLTSLFLFILWKFVLRYDSKKEIPKSLIIIVILFLLNLIISAALSDDRVEGFRELQKYWNLFLCGMLFTCPMDTINRKRIIVVYFMGATIASLVGIFQYYGIFFKAVERAHGFMHPIHYAGNLALAFASAIILLLIRSDFFSPSSMARYVVLFATPVTFAGILFSQSRGVWIALIVSCVTVLQLYSRRKALILAILVISFSLTIFSLSVTLRHRAVSIVTSVYTEGPEGSTGNRLELWKGALIMFSESPILGKGVGSFEIEMNRLIAQGKVKQVPFTTHAHSIFLQTMATQGIVGLVILTAFVVFLFAWGLREVKYYGNIGGYVIIASMLLTIIGGLTENNIEISKYFAAWCLTIGLLGRYGP